MSIIAVGSIAFDDIKTPKGERKNLLGGALTHFSNAASFLSKPKLVGIIGNDFKKEDWDFIISKSSNIEGIKILDNEKCFHWAAYYEEDYEIAHTVKTELNAFEKFDPVVPQSYKENNYILFLANIHPVIQENVIKQCEESRFKMLDTMNYWIENFNNDLKRVLKLVDGIIINEHEAFLLTGEKNILKASEKLLKENLKLIVVKRGANGVMCFTKDYIISLPAYPLEEIVDPTGAGDSFAGALLSFIDFYEGDFLDKELLKKALSYATVLSSFCVSDFGVNGIAKITNADIENRWIKYYNMVSFQI